MSIETNISIGELLDKISILELKELIIKDENKLNEVKIELKHLYTLQKFKYENIFYYNILKWINSQIWDFTDAIKEMVELDEHFAKVSNKIFNYNQYRFRVKNMLNSKSIIKEQKSYKSSIIYVKIDFRSFYTNLTKINKLSILYDRIVLCTSNENLSKCILNIYSTSNFEVSSLVSDESQNLDNIILDEFINIDVFEFPQINYISGGLLGDFIHQLSICNEFFLSTGKKANVYITDKNIEGFSYGSQKAYTDLESLITSQPYINSFKIHDGEISHINLSTWRYSNLLYKTTWSEIFLKEYNITWAKNQWLNIDFEEHDENVVLLNISMRRYVDVDFDYKLLNKIAKKVIFICFHIDEYTNFSKKSDTSFDYMIVNTIDDMCKEILRCYCFIGNLSSPLSIAIAFHKYCIGFVGNGEDSIHMIDEKIPNYYYYKDDNNFTKNIYNI